MIAHQENDDGKETACPAPADAAYATREWSRVPAVILTGLHAPEIAMSSFARFP